MVHNEDMNFNNIVLKWEENAKNILLMLSIGEI